MKLVKQSGGNWRYALNQTQFDLLCHLLRKFPHTESVPAKISKADADPKSVEREKLLNQSMAEHRLELKRQAVNLIAGNKLKMGKKHHLLTLTAEEREIMLQIFNDIRVGCWHALGGTRKLGIAGARWFAAETSMPQFDEFGWLF